MMQTSELPEFVTIFNIFGGFWWLKYFIMKHRSSIDSTSYLLHVNILKSEISYYKYSLINQFTKKLKEL